MRYDYGYAESFAYFTLFFPIDREEELGESVTSTLLCMCASGEPVSCVCVKLSTNEVYSTVCKPVTIANGKSKNHMCILWIRFCE